MKGTTDALATLSLKRLVFRREKFLGVLLELQKAFDCLDHDIPFERLHNLDVSEVSQKCVRIFLQNKTQTGKVEGK